ncbi:hypothetical protein SAMN05216490_3741 [Mucilaginibacter mallensis]|uniref:Uncharacterized protein n=1 Tax=Mucilaginibacter mallensis TaxID=652787 RepID=A0A1H2AWI2_MUCMA|nr:hypothetical protein [Mucilaginibacter mallensis]SDT49856.1 hypothetical protein SAMN05216490_3741 [Mucilaginibacter mallensis]
MKKLFALPLIAAFICITMVAAHAQDSVKTTPTPVTSTTTDEAKPAATVKVKKLAPKFFKKAVDSTTHATITAQKTHFTDTTKVVAAKPEPPQDKTLNGQYRYLLSKIYGGTQQDLVGAFHKSFIDTLTQVRQALKASQDKLTLQTKTIDSLQNSAKTSGESLSEANAKRNEVSLLGIDIDKSTYNIIMWGLVLVFGATAAIVIGRSGAASSEAKYRVQLYNELEEDYKNYKAKANEKEKKLARELQTERNKLDDLLGK